MGLVREIAKSKELNAVPHLSLLLYGPADVAAAAADAISTLLQEANSEDYVWLDEEVRHTYHWNHDGHASHAAWSALPKINASAAARIAAYGIASFHPNGHVRQQAMIALSALNHASAMPFLLVRLNDWVAQVRSAAQSAATLHLQRRQLDGFQQHLPLVIRLLRCGRDQHEGFVSDVLQTLWQRDHTVLVNSLLLHPANDVRRLGYRQLLHVIGADYSDVVLPAIAGSDAVLRLWALRDAIAHLADADIEKILSIVKHDYFAPVRREALAGYLAKFSDRACAELEASLLDPSAAVRDYARFHLRRSGQEDFAGYYRRVILEKGPLRPALAGLSESGSQADVAILRQFTRVDSGRLREVVVRGIGRLSGNEGLQDLLIALQDRCQRVSRAAKQALIENSRDVKLLALKALVATNADSHVRRAAMEILDHIGSWNAVPLLVASAADADEFVATTARRLVLRRINHVFTTPTSQQRASIEDALRVCEERNAVSFASEVRQWLRALTE